MANINLRGTLASGTTLTFAQVDDNFSNLNNESFYGGITFTNGVLKFEPIGSTGGNSDPYPPIQFDLDDTYLNQVSSTDFTDLNSIAKMPDDSAGADSVDAAVDSAGFVSPDDKLLISDQGRLLYNSPSIGVQGVIFDGENSRRDGHNGSWLAHPNHVREQLLADHFQYNANTGTITIDTSNGGLLNRYDEVAGRSQYYSSGTAAFIAQMNHMKGSEGVVLQLYVSANLSHAYRRKITGVSYGQTNGENTSVTITTEISPEGNLGNPSGNTIYSIRVTDEGTNGSLVQLKSPRAPLTPPIAPPDDIWFSGFGQVMVPLESRRIDQADLQLVYGDDTRLICQGLVSKGHMLIRPNTRDASVSTNTINGSQVSVMDTGGGIGGKSLELYGGDCRNTTYNSASLKGGDLTLGGGVNSYRTQSGAVSPVNDGFIAQDDDPVEDYSALTDFSDSSRPLIKLFGRQSYTNTKQNSIVISAGRNYRTSSGTASNFQNRVGGDIRFLLGTGSGQGAPGNLVIEAYDVPTASTTLSNPHNKPNNSADLTPFKIEWDSANYNYKTTISNLDASLSTELAELTLYATAANHPFDVNNTDSITTADSSGFNHFASGIADQPNINIEQGTIIKGVTKSTYDTSETRYDKVYELPFGVESIDPRLMMFSGTTTDVSRNAVGLSRGAGDTIVLGNIQKKTNGDVTFLNGLSIDGDNFHLINNARTAKVDATAIGLTLIGDGTQLYLDNTGASFNDDLDVTGDITATGDVTAFSDESIKENIEVIEDAVDKVQQLNGYTFDRTDVDTSRQTGVIAQEVLKVLPEAVGEKDGIHTVAYGNMVGLLIEAIKEQQGQIDSLKEELQSIKSINK